MTSKLEALKSAGQAAEWLSEEGLATMEKGYLLDEETPAGLLERLAKGAAKYLGNEFYEPIFQMFWKGWLSPATPVAVSFNSGRNALPVSCYGVTPDNSIYSIYDKAKEMALLSKHGGGIGSGISKLKGPTSAAVWASTYDNVFCNVSQGATRRGSGAVYIDYSHPDLMDVLNAKDLLAGADDRIKIDCNIAVCFNDADLERIFSQPTESDLEKLEAIAKLRLTFGSPYIQFTDNALKALPECYKSNRLNFNHSNLCSEIFLHSDAEHTYVCVLSSLVLSRLLEYASIGKDDVQFHSIATINGTQWTAPMLAIAFLDAVCQEFIDKADKIKGLECAVRSAQKGRPLGLGVLGWHTLLQKLELPFADSKAMLLNKSVFKALRAEAEKATVLLAEQFGEPLWCKGFNRRNTHLLALAPTMSNSVLSNGGSASIEPIKSNLYSFEGAKGIFVRKNAVLEKTLADLGLDTPETWQSIANNNGSVQHLPLPPRIKQIFASAMEIDQKAVIQQAIDRQFYIDQGQSLNLFLPPNVSAEAFWSLHYMAWKGGLKSLYYVRSSNLLAAQTTMVPSSEASIVRLKTRPTCKWCSLTKDLLNKHGIAYAEEVKVAGPVPEILFRGQQISYSQLKAMLEPEIAEPAPECEACQG